MFFLEYESLLDKKDPSAGSMHARPLRDTMTLLPSTLLPEISVTFKGKMIDIKLQVCLK